VNFTRNLLINEVATIFPRDLLAVEVLENIVPDETVLTACRKLRKAGYLIVLDDFILKPGFEPLVQIADIIKVDFRISGAKDRHTLLRTIGHERIKFLAEKVETKEEFFQAREMGFSYFQGYFFSRPIIIAGKEVPGYKLTYLQILREINQPETDFEELEHIIKRDVSLAYKLLRFINSAAFSFHTKIQSIKQALTLLGMREIKKWVSLIALSGMGDDKPEELAIVSMSRAKFGEILASKVGMKEKNSDFFLTGMFSMIDAFIDQPMADILADLPLAEPIKVALLGGSNIYRDVIELVIAYERGDWDTCTVFIGKLNLNESEIPEIFITSIEWAHKIFRD
jgi:EAL and modified HD-GYP domain-containing signal transduction protein